MGSSFRGWQFRCDFECDAHQEAGLNDRMRGVRLILHVGGYHGHAGAK